MNTPSDIKTAEQPKEEKRRHRSSSIVKEFGRSYYYITCPFCSDTIKAFVWSIAGKGKKCSCGALHGPFGYTYKKLPS